MIKGGAGKKESIKRKQQKWMEEMKNTKKGEPEGFEDNSYKVVSPSQLIFENWSAVESKIPMQNRRDEPSDTFCCWVCDHKISKPVMVIPCGHSFCSGCVAGGNCPQCSVKISSIVSNLALQSLLEKEDKPEVSFSNPSSLDFDEDPQALAQKYGKQLQHLNERIAVYQTERDTITQNADEKTSLLMQITERLENTTIHMRKIAKEMESMKSKLYFLDQEAKRDEPIARKLESEVSELKARKDKIESALHPLQTRKEKVERIFNGLQNSI